ncbi:MAG: helix-turn-helix transcriptional regulator [Oscillospiraceae bacterium]|nr:helix-turn-helix transcriptional regulator [Oscillospiraceae bacterium]
MKFGDRLRLILDEKEIKQKEFAQMLNIAPTTLNGYINNNREPNIELIVQIANKLNVSLDVLLGNSNECSALSEQEFQLLTKYRKLNESGRNFVYEFICTVDKMKSDKKL